MCSNKKDLEIICNLQWKNRPHNGGERSNIIGVYDIPSTTLNWEIFKSYLLKNSGTPGDDVKVSYLATNGKEFPIQSQLDFQIALYAFRKKARNGEIINLKLDRISDQEKLFKKIPSSNDVQTQFDTIGVCTDSSLSTLDSAPKWFTNHMTEFKREIINEVSATVSGYISTIKSHGVQSYHSRKSKTESSKRSRKHPLILCEVGNEKEFLKTVKFEKKVETKPEKLENKSKKLKEKKMSLLTKSSDSDAGHSSSKSNSDTLLGVDMNQMNAAPVRYQQSVIPHMIGGEVYLHTWEVINNGILPWTSDTELQFTWGSASLEPVERIVPCPPLKPGESGSINVLLNVPKICGQYESYWYFHHKGRKFGHWLGCQIIVDKINSAEPLAKSFLNSYEELKSKYDSANSFFKSQTIQNISNDSVNNLNVSSNLLIQMENQTLAMSDIETKVKDLQIVEACSSSENDQLGDKNKISATNITHFNPASCSSSTDFLVRDKVSSTQTEIEEVILNTSPSKIQIVEKFTNDIEPRNTLNLDTTVNDSKESNQNKQIDTSLESDDNNNNTEGAQDSSSESISKIDEDTTSNSTLNDMVMINFPDEIEDNDTGYAYVLVDGAKIPIPKKYLRSDFLETAEDAPNPTLSFKRRNEVTNSPKTIDTEKMKQYEDDGNSLSTERDNTTPLIPISNYLAQNTAHGSEVSYTFLSQDSQMVNDSVQYNPPVEMINRTLNDQIDDEKSNPRMFVFPQNCPGYEVISNYPVLSESIPVCSDSECPKATTQYAFSNSGECNNQFMRCNIYQQDPSDTAIQYENLPYSTCHQSEFANAFAQQNTANFESSAAPVIFPNHSTVNRQELKSNNSNEFTYVPNYQQTPPELRSPLRKEDSKPDLKMPSGTNTSTSYSFTCPSEKTYSATNGEVFTSPTNMPAPSAPAPAPLVSVVSGAMTMASSALNTAKNVVNMIIPPRNENEPGVWMNGHWVVTNPNTPREANLHALAEMGFWDRDLNATLLARFNDDIAQVVAELIQ